MGAMFSEIYGIFLTLLPFIGILVPLIGLIVTGRALLFPKLSSQQRAWIAWAEEAGMTYEKETERKPESMRGTLRGLPATVSRVSARGLAAEQNDTELTIAIHTFVSRYLAVHREDTTSKLLSALGHPDFQTGNPEVDAALQIRGATAEDRVLLRSPTLQWRLKELFDDFPHSAISDGVLKIRARGFEPGAAARLRRLAEVGDSMVNELEVARDHARLQASQDAVPSDG